MVFAGDVCGRLFHNNDCDCEADVIDTQSLVGGRKDATARRLMQEEWEQNGKV